MGIPAFSVQIETRKARGATGRTRFRVRASMGGHHGRRIDCGTFPTRTLAEKRRALVWRWYAEGDDIETRLSALVAGGETVGSAARSYLATLREPNAKGARNMIARLGSLAGRDVGSVTGRDVQAWINDNADLAPSSLAQYRGHLARAFDFVEADPNPARWRMLRYPSDEAADESVIDPPTFSDLREVIAQQRRVGARRHYADVTVVLEGTGMRMVELRSLTWGDIDQRNGVIRVGRTKRGTAGIRFVPITPEVAEVLDAFPPDDRTGTIYPGLSHSGFDNHLRRACARAGVRVFSPHDLRHRWISRMGHAGFSPSLIRDLSGHAKITTTLDIYSHTMLDEPASRRASLRAAVLAMPGLGGDPESVGDALMEEAR